MIPAFSWSVVRPNSVVITTWDGWAASLILSEWVGSIEIGSPQVCLSGVWMG